MPTRVRSFCKINLGLAVGPARADGFHGLTTLYQTLALHDFVTVSAKRAAETRITLASEHPAVPTDARNTAWKMVAGALERLGVQREVHIEIDKRLPVQGGLGAGSANAVAALLGLERELGVALTGPERLELAAEVGSDVPLFLLGGAVLGLGRGEQVWPLPDFAAVPCVVAVPSVGVSTAQAFRDLDARVQRQGPRAQGPESSAAASLTYPQPTDRLEQLGRALAAVWTTTGAEQTALRGTTGIASSGSDRAEDLLLALVRTGIENDFEEVAFSQHPSLRSTKRDLMGDGLSGAPGAALYAALSGSGSALFGWYRNQADARAAQQRVQAAGTQALLTETLPRQAYWASMFAE